MIYNIYTHTYTRKVDIYAYTIHYYAVSCMYYEYCIHNVYIINVEFFWQIIAMSWCNLGGSFLPLELQAAFGG